MKTYKEFLEWVEKNIRGYMPSDYADSTVKIVRVIKDNDMALDGLIIHKGEAKVQTSPTIYMEQFYRKLTGGADEESILKEIASEFLEAKSRFRHMAPLNIWNWEFAQSKTGYYIVNRDKNKERLCGRVFTNVGELAKVYIIIANVSAGGFDFMLIPQDLLAEWDITEKELEKTADDNMMKRFPPVLHAMEEQIKEMTTGQPAPNRLQKGIDREKPDIYVLTNSMKMYGAAAVLYPGILEQVRNVLDDNFFIIPSSTEEVLIVPEKSGARKEQLKQILMDVNSQMEEKEVLSDNIYEYGKENLSPLSLKNIF